MHNFFTTTSAISQGIHRLPQWQYVRDGLRQNLATVIEYYRKNPTSVHSAHFLVRLLQSITVPQSQNLERYYDNVDAMAMNLSMALQMTSSIYRGKLFNGVFYGEGNSEILIANSDDFDIFEADKHWKNLTPIRVLRHCRSDLAMNLPDGTNTGIEEGISVITINIPMLAIQYRAFRINEFNVTSDEDSQRTIGQFIRMFVIPNMLASHVDHALFNRIMNLVENRPMGESKHKHSFFLPDYSKQVNRLQQEILESLTRASRDFTGTLRTVPLVVKEDLEQLMMVPDIAATRQVSWALTISRLPALLFLFKMAKGGPGTRNQSQVNRILRDVLAYKSQHVMESMLPLELFYEVQDDIQAIAKLAK